MAVRNLQSFEASIWIPPAKSASFKITVTRADGTVDDITDLIQHCLIKGFCNEEIGNFEFTLPNYSSLYNDVWTGMEVFRYYSDYAGVATTLRFLGYIERPSYLGNTLVIKGRANALFLNEVLVTKSYVNSDLATIVLDLIASYGGGRYTTTNVASSTGVVIDQKNWFETPFLTCIKEVTGASGYTFFIDAAFDCHFFLAGSVVNEDEGMVHDNNLIEVTDNASDIQKVKNKVRVYGGKVDGIQSIYTSDGSVGSVYGAREDVVNNSSVTTSQEAKDYADSVRNSGEEPEVTREVRGFLLASIQPGQNIWLSAPLDNIQPDRYEVIGFEHELAEDGLYTTLTISEHGPSIAHILKDRYESDFANQNVSDNPYGMMNSYGFTFDDNVGVHSSTEITKGVLKPTASSGTWLSPSVALNGNLSQCSLVINGSTLTGATVSVSGDGGVSYETIPIGSLHTFQSSIGNVMMVRVVFNDATTQVESLNILYSTV
jgi:hypothetical protein